MHFDLRVIGGIVASSAGEAAMDLGIRDGKIVALGELERDTSDETISARGLTVMPGVIDTQVHFREPGMEHKEDLESGSRAAIFGGVTTFFEMPNTNPTTSTREALEDKLRRAEGRTWCDHGFFVGATTDNAEQLEELEMLPGTPGVKIFMGSSTGTLLVELDDHLRSVLRHGKRRCPIHAEDEARLRERKHLAETVHDHPVWRDPEAARLATERIIRLCEETGRPVHVLHVSTEIELSLLLRAKQQGLPVTCEVTPQHLSLSAPDCYDRLGTFAQMNPPIRSEEHRQALWIAVKHGLFDVFGSDHAPHTIEEKQRIYPGSPSGMPGVQTLLPVLHTWVAKGELTFSRLIAMACENPALLYGIAGKGFLREGYDADFVLLDREAKWTVEEGWLQSKCGWSPYLGTEMVGKVVRTVVRGHTVMADGQTVGTPIGQSARYDWK